MRVANDLGYECILIEDGTGLSFIHASVFSLWMRAAATKKENHESAISQVQMSGGIFGCTTTSDQLLDALIKKEKQVGGCCVCVFHDFTQLSTSQFYSGAWPEAKQNIKQEAKRGWKIVVALGGNALLRRGQAMTAENQHENLKHAAAVRA